MLGVADGPYPLARGKRGETVVALHTVRDLVVRLPIDPDVEARGIGPELPLVSRVALVACGGALGALARSALDGTGAPSSAFPWVTLAINVSGAGLLALLLVVLEERAPTNRALRPLLGTGVLGGYTTFSTFAVETVVMLRAGAVGHVFAYLAASVVGAVLAATAGVVLARTSARLVDRPGWHRRRLRAMAERGSDVGWPS